MALLLPAAAKPEHKDDGSRGLDSRFSEDTIFLLGP